ncbi:MAG: zf-HC2 domain-containing protein [Desulfobacterales bacterium]|nr:zf-HC2 domain-containing protein [Desulfobacterales bacterium]
MKATCPNEETLTDYLEGRLSEEERSQVEMHLSECEICLERIVVANGLAQGRDRFELDLVPNEVTEAAVRLVTSQAVTAHGSLMEKVRGSVNNIGSTISEVLRPRQRARWELAPIRGSKTVVSDDLVCLRVPFDEIETEIEIEKTGSGKAHIRVKPHEVGKQRKTVRITLKKGEREIASYLSDGAYVLFEDVPFGHYSISLAENSVRLGTCLFEIKETGHGRK